MIRTALAILASVGLLAACNNATSGHPVKTLDHFTVEALIEQQAHATHATCNGGHDMPEKPGASYHCHTSSGKTYTVTIGKHGRYAIR